MKRLSSIHCTASGSRLRPSWLPVRAILPSTTSWIATSMSLRPWRSTKGLEPSINSRTRCCTSEVNRNRPPRRWITRSSLRASIMGKITPWRIRGSSLTVYPRIHQMPSPRGSCRAYPGMNAAGPSRIHGCKIFNNKYLYQKLNEWFSPPSRASRILLCLGFSAAKLICRVFCRYLSAVRSPVGSKVIEQ